MKHSVMALVAILFLSTPMLAAPKKTKPVTDAQIIHAIRKNDATKLRKWIDKKKINGERWLASLDMTPLMLATWLDKTKCTAALKAMGAHDPFGNLTKSQARSLLREMSEYRAGLLYIQKIRTVKK